jgi:hypothetical protein
MAFLALGHPKDYFHLEIIKLIFLIIFIPMLSYWGITGIAISVALASLVATYISMIYIKKFIGYGVISQTRDQLGTVLCIMGAFCAYCFLNILLTESNLLSLAISMAVSIFTYFLIALLVNKQTLHELHTVAKNVLNKPKKEFHSQEVV